MSKSKILFIINPFSGGGKGKKVLPKIEKYLDAQAFEWTYRFTEAKGHATQIAGEACRDGFDIVAAVGGDGTVNEVAQALANTDKTMAIIPAGSGNGLAMYLGLGRKAKTALAVLNRQHSLLMDTCQMNERAFVNLAGVGFDGLVAYKAARSKGRGFMAYFKELLQAAWNYHAEEYELFIDDMAFKDKYLFVEVANAPMFGYNFKVAPTAKLNDGLLEVVLVEKAAKWRYFDLIPKMLLSDIEKSNLVKRFSAKEVTFYLRHKSPVHIDGEGFFAEGEIKFSINPLSLRIICASM